MMASNNELKKQERMQIATVLNTLRPSVFNLDTPKPLDLGIYRQIKELLPDIKQKQLKPFMKWWCARKCYLAAVAAEDSCRHDINGCQSVKVSDKHRAYATEFLERRTKVPDVK